MSESVHYNSGEWVRKIMRDLCKSHTCFLSVSLGFILKLLNINHQLTSDLNQTTVCLVPA